MHLAPIICPREDDLAPFAQEVLNVKRFSKRKKFLEIREVAKTLPSNLWKALTKNFCLALKERVTGLYDG